MRRRWLLSSLIGIVALVAGAVTYGLAGSAANKPVESLLPADPFLCIHWEGTESRRAEWEKTAAYESLEKSGLLGTLFKLVLSYVPIENKKDADELRDLIQGIARKGFSLTANLSSSGNEGQFDVAFILHDSASLELLLRGQLGKLAGASTKIETRSVRGRAVSEVRGFGGENSDLAWWSEGGHLVVAIGPAIVETMLDVADAKSSSIASSALWKKYRQKRDDYDPAFCAWLDAAALIKRFGNEQAGPNMKINDILTAVGVEKVQSLGLRCGFRDRALLTELTFDSPAPRTGLLALLDQRPISLKDLPPMPVKSTGFIAASFDWSKAYDTIVGVAREVFNLEQPNGSEQVDRVVNDLPLVLGFDLKKDLFDALGNVVCFYDDVSPIPGPFGIGLAVQVKNPEKLKKTVSTLLGNLQAQFGNQLTVTNEERRGRTMHVFDIESVPVHPALCIDKQWLFVALTPQSLESCLARVDGKLESWKPSAADQAALDSAPKEFVAMTLSDPRTMYSSIMTFLPAILPFVDRFIDAGSGPGSGGRASNPRMAILSSMPAVATVTGPMFPNVTTWTVDKEGLHSRSRESAPSILSASTAAVGVALLLPAVQASRTAARRTQSRNNLKQMMLACHNYHDVNQSFPQGTVPNKKLKPEQRLSWQTSLLPFVEQNNLYAGINREKGWEDPDNRTYVTAQVPVFLNPAVSQTKQKEYPVTHYVGLAGLGPEGPTLPVNNPKAGCFAYDRVTKISDITDGTSTTAMISEASKDYGSWAAGGRPTIRPLTKEPVMNGPDGIGGPSPEGCMVALADGSVRFISKSINPATFKALVTIAGGERLNLDQ